MSNISQSVIEFKNFLLDDNLQIKDIADSIGVSRATVLREIQEIKKTESLYYDKKEKR